MRLARGLSTREGSVGELRGGGPCQARPLISFYYKRHGFLLATINHTSRMLNLKLTQCILRHPRILYVTPGDNDIHY